MKNIKLVFAIFILLLSFCFMVDADTYAIDRPSDLKNKENLNKNLLAQVNQTYSENDVKVDITNKKNSSQILGNDLTFDNVPMPGGGGHVNNLRVEFDSDTTANRFKDKMVDIFGVNYYIKCVGESGKESACMYGGLTPHEGNVLNEKVSIGINVFKDGQQMDTEIISTNKKEVTIQELDVKARTIINKKHNIYDINKHNIKYGIIKFHNNHEKEKSFYYDLYNFYGENMYEFLKMYNDNKTIIAKDYHIDIYLYNS